MTAASGKGKCFLLWQELILSILSVFLNVFGDVCFVEVVGYSAHGFAQHRKSLLFGQNKGISHDDKRLFVCILVQEKREEGGKLR